MIEATVSERASYLLLGPVRGLLSEAPKLLERLESFRPAAIGLGLSEEEAKGLRDYFTGAAAEPVVALSPHELAEVRGLVRFGEIQVPNPSFAQAIAWADGRGVPLEAIDPSDDRYAEMFAEHIGYTELLRRTLRERRLSRRPPEVRTADEFSLAWAQATSASGGSGRLARAREEAVVAKARSLGARYPRVALVVDRERFPTLLAAFGPPAPA